MSQILTITCAVSRTSLSLPQLELEVDGKCRVTRFSPGARAWDRQVVSSRYAHGSAKAGPSVLAHGTEVLGLRIYGASASALEANVAEVVTAFSQDSYLVGLNIDGVLHQWSCWEADIEVASGDYDKFALARHQQEYTLTIPRHPIATAGAL